MQENETTASILRLTAPFRSILLSLDPHVFEHFINFGITGRKLAQRTAAYVNLDHNLRGVSRGTDWLMRAPSKNMTTPSEVAVKAEDSSGSGSVADHRHNFKFVKLPVKIRLQSIETLPRR